MAAVSGFEPRLRVAEFADWTLYLNADQSLLGRCFLALNRPEADAAALTDAELTALWALTRRVKQALWDQWGVDHFNYAFLMNQDPQVHFHVIPRYREKREFAGGTYADPEFGKHYNVGPARTLDYEGYEAIINALRRKLA